MKVILNDEDPKGFELTIIDNLTNTTVTVQESDVTESGSVFALAKILVKILKRVFKESESRGIIEKKEG